jgi:hypothetical protein
MNENTKTLTLVAAAVVVMLLVWAPWTPAPQKDTGDVRGQLLVADFDPQSAASLEIVEFDEDTATVRPFKVAKVVVKGKTRWSIPSHENYPTDAKDQLADVAAGLMGRKILDVAGDSPGDHALYGVLDADPKVRKVGDTGVGTRVTMKDQSDKELLSLVIGKAVPDKSDLHYVRRVGDDHVYVVDVKTDKISTKFEKWIEKDLLKLSTWDIKQLWIRDYSADLSMDLTQRGALTLDLIQRGEMALEYNDTGEPKWKMIKDAKFDHRRGEWVPVQMADDEELNTSKLDDMKNALGDLKIVDVTHKPEGLSADLKAEADFAKHLEAVESLARRGFFVARAANQMELFSNEGEVRCSMKDGLQYVLRFGDIVPETAGGSSKEDKGADKEKDKGGDQEKKPKSTGLNRYLFVTAEFNPDIVPKPQLESLPGEKKEAADAEKSAAGKSADEKKAQQKAKEKKPKAKKAKKAEQDPPEETKADEQKLDEAAADEKKADDKPADEKKPEKSEAAKDEKKGEAAKDEKKSGEKAAAEAEQQRIEKENKRKQDEYDEKIKKGKERVTELNARFADWYYIISDEVYHKIHLGRNDIVKKKEKDKDKDKDKDKEKDKEKAATEGSQAEQGKTEKPAGEQNPVGELEQLKKEGPGGKEQEEPTAKKKAPAAKEKEEPAGKE